MARLGWNLPIPPLGSIIIKPSRVCLRLTACPSPRQRHILGLKLPYIKIGVHFGVHFPLFTGEDCYRLYQPSVSYFLP